MKYNVIATILIATLSFSCLALEDKALADPTDTEVWDPEPKLVTPNPVPSDALVLFDGTSLTNWQHGDGRDAEWLISGGAMTVKPGSKGIKTKQSFCNVQLHVEWRSPELVEGHKGQHLGNSGIFLQGRYEVQVLNSHQNRTYANGQAASIYKQSPPLVNASLPAMQWQSYDIIYSAPEFDEKGNVKDTARVTVLHNGVLVQNHFEIQGATTYRGKPKYPVAHGCAPIFIQDHGSLVSYRNIWVRELH